MIFTVALALQSDVENEGVDPIVELRVVAVDAADEAEARSTGERIGRESEHSYCNADGHRVSWTFRSVVKVYQLLDPLQLGSELFSMFLTSDEFISISAPFAELSLAKDSPWFSKDAGFQDTAHGSRIRVN